jgi:hypothetical protein
LGKSIDEIRQQLGKGKEDSPEPTKKIKAFSDTWDSYWEKNGNSIMVNFNWKSRKLVDIFIAAPDSEPGSTTDWEYLVKLGHLDKESSQYKIVPVKSFNEPGRYTGIKVIPN